MIRCASHALVVFVLLSFSLNASAQWKTLDSQFPPTLSLSFTSEDTGYASWHTILKTTNGGVTFDSLVLPANIKKLAATLALRTMSWPTSAVGYAGGEVLNAFGAYNGVLLKTTNAGKDWVQISVDTNYLIWQMIFPSPNVGYAMESTVTNLANRIVKTTDGGNSWNVVIPASQNSIPAMNFRNDNEGFIAQRDDLGVQVKYTSDGLGSTPSIRVNGMNPPAPSVVFAFVPTEDTAWLASADGFLYRTTDLGGIWNKVRMDNEPFLQSLVLKGHIGFEYSTQPTKGMNYTTDFGHTWNATIIPDSGGSVKALTIPSVRVGYALISISGSSYQLIKWSAPKSVQATIAASELLSVSYASDEVTFSYTPSNNGRTLGVYDLLGRKQRSLELAARSHSVSMAQSALKAGIYFARTDRALAKFLIAR